MAKKKDPAKDSPFASLKKLRDELATKEAAATSKTAHTKAAPTPAKAPPKVEEFVAADDALAFHRMMSGVTPIDRTRARIPLTAQRVDPSNAKLLAKTARELAAAEAEAVHAHLRALVQEGSRFEMSDDGRRAEGRRVDLPPEALRKLRRGIVPIDVRLDLHGLRVEEAREKLAQFLRHSRANRERCVLVVHGKGEHSAGGVGVLRGEIAAWLSQGRPSEHVAAFATAQDADGGEGAMYVLLKQ
jgi:DNA-nicking Smr family endonuclease